MTLTYALAKELKDAGWPQPERSHLNFGRWMCPVRGDAVNVTPGKEVYSPSLSELIDGCPPFVETGNGDSCFMLAFRRDSADDTYDGWHATYWAGSIVGSPDGKSPEEAVAKLWLALQKETALGA